MSCLTKTAGLVHKRYRSVGWASGRCHRNTVAPQADSGRDRSPLLYVARRVGCSTDHGDPLERWHSHCLDIGSRERIPGCVLHRLRCDYRNCLCFPPNRSAEGPVGHPSLQVRPVSAMVLAVGDMAHLRDDSHDGLVAVPEMAYGHNGDPCVVVVVGDIRPLRVRQGSLFEVSLSAAYCSCEE